jgi:outer membrane PBP1 activator LpoA protein
MPRFNAILLAVLLSGTWPAFSADPPQGTTAIEPQPPAGDDIDPETGFARSTIVRKLVDPAAAARAPLAPVNAAGAPPVAAPNARPHIALILPTASESLGRLAEAVRLGFAAARDVAGPGSPNVNVTAVENEGAVLIDACRHSQLTGALIIVGGLTRDGARTLATSDCAKVPVLALNEVFPPDGRERLQARVHSISLSLDQEARQAALMAVADGFHSAVVIASPSALARRVQDAFDREWTRAAGEIRRVTFSGNAEDAPALRDRIAASQADMVFFALDTADARALRPYIPATLPVYATSFSVNPRAETVVNVDLQGVRYGEMPWFVQPDHPAVMVYPQPTQPMSVEQERLYALGIDALRLALLLVKPEGAPPQLDGVTGRITLEPDNTFLRTLVPSEVDGGRVVPLHAAQ